MNKDLNFDLKDLKTRLLAVPQTLRKYVVPVFAIIVLGIFGWLAWQITSLANIQPSDEKIAAEQQIIKRPQIDEETIQKIEQLESKNIAVQGLFKTARDNPFGE